MDKIKCPSCKGSRLKKESLYFKINDKNISELSEMDIVELVEWFEKLPTKLSKSQTIISKEILKEISTRLQFLLDVGLDYLSISRSSKSLSGGEAQRIRLATQIGSQLVGVLYILDEPSIGLHQRDNEKLIKSLIALRDVGNSRLILKETKQHIPFEITEALIEGLKGLIDSNDDKAILALLDPASSSLMILNTCERPFFGGMYNSMASENKMRPILSLFCVAEKASVAAISVTISFLN